MSEGEQPSSSSSGPAEKRPGLMTRRTAIVRTFQSGIAFTMLEHWSPWSEAAPAQDSRPELSPEAVTVTLNINGEPHTLSIEPRVTLLDALREHLGLQGTKKGCDHGQCGACTVLINRSE